MKRMPDQAKADVLFDEFVGRYEGLLAQRLAEELTEDEFRRKRLELGFYGQRPETSYMYRIKMPAGRLTVPQARILADLAAQHGKNEAHITTRQDIQFHYISIKESAAICRSMYTVGLNTVGSCTDSARNVTVDRPITVSHRWAKSPSTRSMIVR